MLEIPRLAILVIILGIASYHDIRTREIPDYLWVVGGGAGAVLYLFDWQDVDLYVVFSMGMGTVIAALVWRIFPMGDADALAVLVSSVVYPVSFGSIMTPVAVFFGGLILEHTAAFFYNLRYNIEDMIRSGKIFANVDGSWITKAMAFYSVHSRRPDEKFTFCAESINDGRRSISLRTPSPDSEYETRKGVLVTWAMPAFPFMLAALVIGAAVASFLL